MLKPFHFLLLCLRENSGKFPSIRGSVKIDADYQVIVEFLRIKLDFDSLINWNEHADEKIEPKK